MIRESFLFVLVAGGAGGGQRIALAVTRRLIEDGHAIAVAAPDDGTSLQEFRNLGARTFLTGDLRSHNLIKVTELARLIRDAGITCVYTHTVPVHEGLWGWAAHRAGVRLAIHRHAIGHFSSRLIRRAYQIWLWGRCLRWASEVICVSSEISEQVMQLSARETSVIPNGVPIPPISIDSVGNAPLIGFVGRLDVNKRLEDFISAAALIRKIRPDARFVVVGSGLEGIPYETNCRTLAQELGLGDVLEFLGPLPDTDAVMRSLDILVLPSLIEGHSLVLLEAMALGKAVIATDISGTRETILHGINGWLVPVHRPDAIADAVVRLLGAPSERARLGNAAREHVEKNFSEERMLERILPLLIR